jgi:ABC-type sugar transport system permease subunit
MVSTWSSSWLACKASLSSYMKRHASTAQGVGSNSGVSPFPYYSRCLLVNVTLALMGGFNVFDIPYVMTEGGPANSTIVMALHIYIRGFKFYRFGYATALSYVLLLLVTIIAAIQLKLMSRSNVE